MIVWMSNFIKKLHLYLVVCEKSFIKFKVGVSFLHSNKIIKEHEMPTYFFLVSYKHYYYKCTHTLVLWPKREEHQRSDKGDCS